MNWKKILVTSVAVLALFSTTSCGKNKSNIQILGVKGPTLAIKDSNLLVSMVFENIQMEGNLKYVIPSFENSSLELAPDVATSGTQMNITVSPKDILNRNFTKLDPLKLPGGRNLPGVSTGALPGVAFSVEKFNHMTFYLGTKVFAIFIPADIGVDGAIASFRYYVNSKVAGTISVVGKDEKGENSGILLMLNLTIATPEQMKMMKLVSK